jgi:ADP-heptose:LPS heptosyltransferase
MMSLIEHCSIFVGNDSGPAVIAQCYGKKTFAVFGATHPDYVRLGENLIPIYNRRRHSLCAHTSRGEEIECCEEFCMAGIRVRDAYDVIISNL